MMQICLLGLLLVMLRAAVFAERPCLNIWLTTVESKINVWLSTWQEGDKKEHQALNVKFCWTLNASLFNESLKVRCVVRTERSLLTDFYFLFFYYSEPNSISKISFHRHD